MFRDATSDASPSRASRAARSVMLTRPMPPRGIGGHEGTRPLRTRSGVIRSLPLLPLTLALTAMASGCDQARNTAEYAGTPVIIGDTLLRFPDGSEYVSGFRNVEYIGAIAGERKAPFIIIAGHECGECDAPPSVLMRSPSDGPVRNFTGLPGWHPYPGRVIAFNNDSAVISHSRLFWGQCLPERPPGLIEYRTEFAGDGTEPQREVRITEIEGDSLLEWRRVATTRLLATTLVQVQAKQCTEVPQRDIPAPP